MNCPNLNSRAPAVTEFTTITTWAIQIIKKNQMVMIQKVLNVEKKTNVGFIIIFLQAIVLFLQSTKYLLFEA